MNPLTLNPLPLLGGAVVAVAIGFGTGWMVNGWRLESNLAIVQKDVAESRAISANAALDQLAGRLETMNTSTTAAALDMKTFSQKLDVGLKELKNAQAQAPLRPDCVPDAGRMRNLREAVGAANAAIQGAASR